MRMSNMTATVKSAEGKAVKSIERKIEKRA
jgi:hypothetical protein